MSIKQEFEKAYYANFDVKDMPTHVPKVAFWAALWAMDRCVEMCEASTSNSNDTYNMGGFIRQLAKELE